LSKANLISQQTTPSPEELNLLIVDAIQEAKGKDIKLFDLREIEEASTDFFVICHGNSSTQLNGIISKIEKKVFEAYGLRPNHAEGHTSKSWMLLDYFDVVIHVFSEDKRAFYNLEDLWSDAEVSTFDDA